MGSAKGPALVRARRRRTRSSRGNRARARLLRTWVRCAGCSILCRMFGVKRSRDFAARHRIRSIQTRRSCGGSRGCWRGTWAAEGPGSGSGYCLIFGQWRVQTRHRRSGYGGLSDFLLTVLAFNNSEVFLGLGGPGCAISGGFPDRTGARRLRRARAEAAWRPAANAPAACLKSGWQIFCLGHVSVRLLGQTHVGVGRRKGVCDRKVEPMKNDVD